jgi:transposase
MSEHSRVVIGMDPHKRSITVEVMQANEHIVGHGRFGTDVAGFAQLVGFASQWPDRVWAIEGCAPATPARPCCHGTGTRTPKAGTAL